MRVHVSGIKLSSINSEHRCLHERRSDSNRLQILRSTVSVPRRLKALITSSLVPYLKNMCALNDTFASKSILDRISEWKKTKQVFNLKKRKKPPFEAYYGFKK